MPTPLHGEQGVKADIPPFEHRVQPAREIRRDFPTLLHEIRNVVHAFRTRKSGTILSNVFEHRLPVFLLQTREHVRIERREWAPLNDSRATRVVT